MPKFTRIMLSQKRDDGWLSISPGTSADAYIRYLAERGYAESSIHGYFGSVAHFVHWLSLDRSGFEAVSKISIGRFLDEHLPHCRCAPLPAHQKRSERRIGAFSYHAQGRRNLPAGGHKHFCGSFRRAH